MWFLFSEGSCQLTPPLPSPLRFPGRASVPGGVRRGVGGRPPCSSCRRLPKQERWGRAPFPAGSWLEEVSLGRGAALLLWAAGLWPPLGLLAPSGAKRASVP